MPISVLSLFTIVSWKQGPCTSTAGTNGTCYSSNECTNLGGTASGTCASGFGVCCLVTVTCGGSTSVNGTYFQNPGYPSTYDRFHIQYWLSSNQTLNYFQCQFMQVNHQQMYHRRVPGSVSVNYSVPIRPLQPLLQAGPGQHGPQSAWEHRQPMSVWPVYHKWRYSGASIMWNSHWISQ